MCTKIFETSCSHRSMLCCRHSPLSMNLRTVLGCFLLLAGCTAAPATPEPVANSAAASSQTSSVVVASSSSVSSVRILSYAEALDREFVSKKHGISVRYPSTFSGFSCPEALPVEARDGAQGIEFVVPDLDLETCTLKESSSVLKDIYVQRATTDADVRRFIAEVFSPDCVIQEQSEHEGIARLFLKNTKPVPLDAPDFTCAEMPLWNKKAGVILWSPLGSKTGGAPDWPSNDMFFDENGEQQQIFDFTIMNSVRYLEAVQS
jgi:hypothetical protein